MQKSTVVSRLYCRRAQACFILFVRERKLEWMSDWMLCILADVEDIPSIFLITWSARIVSNLTVSNTSHRMMGMISVKTQIMRRRHFAAWEMSGVHITGAHVNLQRYSQKKVEKIHSTLM